jgi:hypothetical protein
MLHVTAEANTNEQQSISENPSGGETDMAKETKSKSGKSGWHEIRAGAPTTNDTVEAAKQSEESPKTMAASASAEASHIANIVDSVLADLRPKIVEEIAKQLAKK